MPLTLTVTEGVLPKGQENTVFAKLSDLMIEAHGLKGNRVMTPNITGTLHILPKGSTFTGSKATDAIFVEWKVPSFAFSDRQVQLTYFQNVTDYIVEVTGGKLPREHVFINVLHAVDGAWNFNGTAMTNAEIIKAIS
jgi:hypothetical protein